MLDYVEFQSAGKTLRGMLHAPDGPDRRPCVMMLHGFTGNRIESHFLFVTIARRLAKAGIACLRFDFAGSGESDGLFEEMTTSGEASDAEAALDFLRAHPRIDRDRIGAAGLSLGGAVAGLLVGRRGPQVKALALMAAVADPSRVASIVRTGKYEAQLARLGYVDLEGLKLSRAFLQDLDGLAPTEDVAGYGGPVLIVHGSGDEMLPVSEAYAYREARSRSPEPTRFEIIPDASHTFMNLDHTDALCRMLTEFFTEHL